MNKGDVSPPAASEGAQTHEEPDDDTTRVTSVASTRHAMAAPTLRQRLVKANDASVTQRSKPAPTALVTPIATFTRTSVVSDSVSRDIFVWSPYRVMCVGFGILIALLLSLLVSFLLLDVYVFDGLDVNITVARLEMAGKGREWFPVWMANLVINSVTASRVNDTHGAVGHGSLGASLSRGRGPAPPPLRKSQGGAPKSPRGGTTSPFERSDATGGHALLATPPPPSTGLRCYTLEEYSDTFLQSHRKPTMPHLFSCGTRVVDLRSEERQEVLAGCQAGVEVKQRHDSLTSPMRGGESSFPSLRVVLTPQEVQWHREVQPTNVVSPRIPLGRVNDDYCDCLDGTDELLTNACSMSGPLTPATSSRWKSYLVSLHSLRLWEAHDVIAQEDSEERGYPLQPRKRGDVEDRLYVSNGPVLPFVCTCGTVRQLLAPSLIGDGIVDCCEAEDEAVLQGTLYRGAAPQRLGEDPTEWEAHNRALEAVRAAMMMQWKQRKVSASQYPSLSPSPYEDKLFPYHTSARAMLVDKGYYSLYTSLEVQQERRTAAAVLKKLYAAGHLIQRSRVEEGWDRLGRHLVGNRTQLQAQLVSVIRELGSLEQYVRRHMDEARTNDPLAAGVSMEQLRRHARLMQMRDGLNSEVQHISLATLHRAYGDHYEYYPLFRRVMHLKASHLVDPSTPPTLDAGIAQQRRERIITPTELDRMNTAAHSARKPAPPLHVDNISVSDYGVEVMRHTLVAQRFDSHDAPHIAQRLGLLPNGNISAYTPDIFNRTTSPFQRAPTIPTGFWQPYRTHRDGRVMVIADPAGDVHLAHRACVAPASTLYRGGGRLQWPTRHPEAPHVVRIPDAQEEKETAKDKIKAASAGETTKEAQMYIPYHTNMPSVLAVDVYDGGIRCEWDSPLSSLQTLRTHVVYLCDTQDEILHWAKNGKCSQEVVIGTPSACTGWALKVATKRLEEIEGRGK
ncbi:hypothetical protein JKF63_06863 [Porcisia hertigi]|uniref:Uncharacterized protein n=1 Tax=Porcisia hertigi TaxID=2761500 RepID=A0A836LJ90_9TRYP|nr:hypothetical protein JKF63_06863 [Porcisia hertigi]